MSTNHTATGQLPSAEQIAGCARQDRGNRHRHGTRAAYTQDGCRCPSCQRANRTAQQARRRAIAYGQWRPYTDAETIRAHLTQLLDSGISLATVAARAGVSRGTLHPLLSTQHAATRPRLRAETAQRIRQVKPGSHHPALVDSTGAKRRVQALTANGWSMTRLAAHVHCHPSTISRLLHSTTITRNIDYAIRDIYTRLAEQPVSTATTGERISVEAARRYADVHGWATPDRWTDIDHDLQPHSRRADTDIDQVAISRVLDGQPTQLNYRERRLAAQLLTAEGLSTRDIAERLAVDPRTVSRYRSARADPKDLPRQQAPSLAQRNAAAGPHGNASRPIAGAARGPRSR
jgi:transcriptional regulator with XRE-family HTH domain